MLVKYRMLVFVFVGGRNSPKLVASASAVIGYTGNSFRDYSYIDTSMTRACSKQCRCRRLELTGFAFEVRKTVYGINVRLCSVMLLPILLAQRPNLQFECPDVSDGFYLLENIDILESRL